jgi:hypothetical protein
MTQHLTLNTVIHAAVRRDVARFQQALATFPIGSRERAAQLEMAWQNLDHQLYHHHHGEETIFWPALRELGADESLVGDLGGEHERLAEAMTLTRKAMSALASEPSEVNVDQARAAFDTLGDVVDTHFTHEERDGADVGWSHRIASVEAGPSSDPQDPGPSGHWRLARLAAGQR